MDASSGVQRTTALEIYGMSIERGSGRRSLQNFL